MNNKVAKAQSIELRPHQVEAVLNKHLIGPVRVFQKVVDPKLKVQSPESEVQSEDRITAAEVLRDAKGIVARALARGSAKIVPDHNAGNTRNYAHKTKRRWTPKQRAARSKMLKREFKAGERIPPNCHVKTTD